MYARYWLEYLAQVLVCIFVIFPLTMIAIMLLLNLIRVILAFIYKHRVIFIVIIIALGVASLIARLVFGI